MKAAAIPMVALFLALASSASAITYHGEITYTISRVSPYATGIQIGDTFSGAYSYESDTVDGRFSRDIVSQAGDPHLLSMSVFVPVDFCPEIAGGGDYISLPGTSRMSAIECWMVVAGGIVTEFNWGPEYGPWAMTLATNYFAAWNMMYDDDSGSSATVSFSRPKATNVPDIVSTGGLLALAILVSCALRTQTRCDRV